MPTIDNKKCSCICHQLRIVKKNGPFPDYTRCDFSCEHCSPTPEKKERPMTEGEAEIARDLDKFMSTPSWEEELYRKYNQGNGHDVAIVDSISELKSFISQLLKEEREKEHKFFLNILDGIDAADKDMGNIGGGTRAIRHALKSRYIGLEDGKNNIK